MHNTADVRKINKNRIRRIFWTGGAYSKQQIAELTGLSVATCNTLLNEMLEAGEVSGEKARVAEVGRSTVRYQINECYESILCVAFELIDGQRKLCWWLLSTLGNVLDRKSCCFDYLDYDILKDQIQEICRTHTNVSQIIVGTPSIAEHGIIRHCDIPELEGAKIVDGLTAEFAVPVLMENDMHLKAYGLYKKQGADEGVVTLANFPAHIMPGTASIHGGTILKGRNQFAGMVGFLPYGMERKQYLSQLQIPECIPLIEKAVVSIIAIVNPDTIVFTGDLVTPKILTSIRERCRTSIPEEYIPHFLHEENMDGYYLEGMYQQALNQKESY